MEQTLSDLQSDTLNLWISWKLTQNAEFKFATFKLRESLVKGWLWNLIQEKSSHQIGKEDK